MRFWESRVGSIEVKEPARLLSSLATDADPAAPTRWFTGRVPLSKRVLDLTLIFLCLPVLLPLFGAIALYIKLVSRGPVFFTQERIGFRERRFRIFKFRSMRTNAEVKSHQSHTEFLYKSNKPMEKLDHVDPRLIPFAWIIRSTGLDELPQLINVVLGQMSIVGPRPCTAYEHEIMQPWHCRRFDVLPGLTGLWQINGKNKTTFQQMINYDIAYARECSAWFDLKIMFSTFPVLLGQLREMIEKKRQAKLAAATAPSAA